MESLDSPLSALLSIPETHYVPAHDPYPLFSANGFHIRVCPERDSLLNEFAKSTLKERYILPGETFQQAFGRVACAFADDEDHAQRMYNYISMLHFLPATPILSNGGAGRGMPISCFLSSTDDSLEGIVGLWTENVWLASNGGGIGNYWGNLRSIGEKVGKAGFTSGIMPFIAVQDRLTLAISQGSLRRGSSAVYLDVGHPEIEEFLKIRKATGGDPNRKALNLHHGIVIPDAFMEAVVEGKPWFLTSPKDGHIVKQIDARALMAEILIIRLETGEPYLFFVDQVNRGRKEHTKLSGLFTKFSNLCIEITNFAGRDHHGKDRTAVCCLGSINMERWDEFKSFLGWMTKDCLRYLDKVLSWFIESAPPGMERATYSAMMERSVGLGIMGFHGYLQSKNIPFESALAKSANMRFFSQLKEAADEANVELANERGPCPDAAEHGLNLRFTNMLALAPTASISTIAGASPGAEPTYANLFTQKTLDGSFEVRNPHLEKLLEAKGLNVQETWTSIAMNKGSVQHLDDLSDWEKDVFKTAFELDQYWIVDHAADRQPFICQSQSTNLFMRPDVDKAYLLGVHMRAWKLGMKSLYYLRSESIGSSGSISKKVDRVRLDEPGPSHAMDAGCLSCQ